MGTLIAAIACFLLVAFGFFYAWLDIRGDDE